MAVPRLCVPAREDDGAATDISEDHVKVRFRMEVDDDGWPPVSVESLWAVDLGDGTVRLDNTPWFVRGIAGGDIVKVGIEEDGLRWAGETVRSSENCTIRLIVLKDGGSAAARQTVLETFHRLGTTGEGIEQFRMVARGRPAGGGHPAHSEAVGSRRGQGVVVLGRRVCHFRLEGCRCGWSRGQLTTSFSASRGSHGRAIPSQEPMHTP
ncbi:DUF4265 domain-containing protein (plasmid) [Embleya sp. NBC_00888]|nr:DUF4265 domain-containing protein [Embleya sp. NBC_00888]